MCFKIYIISLFPGGIYILLTYLILKLSHPPIVGILIQLLAQLLQVFVNIFVQFHYFICFFLVLNREHDPFTKSLVLRVDLRISLITNRLINIYFAVMLAWLFLSLIIIFASSHI
jgi:hypothetical protein